MLLHTSYTLLYSTPTGIPSIPHFLQYISTHYHMNYRPSSLLVPARHGLLDILINSVSYSSTRRKKNSTTHRNTQSLSRNNSTPHLTSQSSQHTATLINFLSFCLPFISCTDETSSIFRPVNTTRKEGKINNLHSDIHFFCKSARTKHYTTRPILLTVCEEAPTYSQPFDISTY